MRTLVVGAMLAVTGIAHGTPPDESSSSDPRQRIELGARLFFDARLSADGKTACASCHEPGRAFTDGRVVAIGSNGVAGVRNTPSLLDVAQRSTLGWDGREFALQAQVLKPYTNPREHNLQSERELERRVASDASYVGAFSRVFGGERPTVATIGAVLADYVRSLTHKTSAFDRYQKGDAAALSVAQKRGYALFTGGAGCSSCHRIGESKPGFTDDSFHSQGVGLASHADRLPSLIKRVSGLGPAELEAAIANSPELASLGRYLVTANPKDIAAYRTPSLRNVALTAPYFHDGSAATLEMAVAQELYHYGRTKPKKYSLTPAEAADLVEFLRALTDEQADDRPR